MGISTIFYFADVFGATSAPGLWVSRLVSMLIGAALLIGFMTPVSGGLATLLYLAVTLCRQFTAIGTCHHGLPATIYLAAMSAALTLLGPGSFSLDARLFGRREILIPARRSQSEPPDNSRGRPD